MFITCNNYINKNNIYRSHGFSKQVNAALIAVCLCMPVRLCMWSLSLLWSPNAWSTCIFNLPSPLCRWYVSINDDPDHGFSCASYSWHCWTRCTCRPVFGVFRPTELKTCLQVFPKCSVDKWHPERDIYIQWKHLKLEFHVPSTNKCSHYQPWILSHFHKTICQGYSNINAMIIYMHNECDA